MITIKNLKRELERSINDVFIVDAKGNIVLRDDLTIGDMMNFKSVESVTNNILAVAQTCAFADEIGEEDIKNHISNPNAKGFDVDYKCDGKRILAELKATVPCKLDGDSKKYGSNQAKSISTDLENLVGISDKGQKAQISPNDKKYMVLIGIAGQKVAFDKLKKPEGYNEKNIQIVYVKPTTCISAYDDCGWKT